MTYESSSFTAIHDSRFFAGRKTKSTRWPGYIIPTADLPMSACFISTERPPSRVMISTTVSGGNPRVIPVSDLIQKPVSEIRNPLGQYQKEFVYPVFITRTLYELWPSRKIEGDFSLSTTTQSNGRAGTAFEQLNFPAPFTSRESGTGWLESSGQFYTFFLFFFQLQEKFLNSLRTLSTPTKDTRQPPLRPCDDTNLQSSIRSLSRNYI